MVAGVGRLYSLEPTLNDLPAITHLQFLILDSLVADERAGQDVRDALERHGARRTLPAFYELMARLEKAGFVDGSYAAKTVNGQQVRERRYQITEAGREAHTATCAFYRDAMAGRLQEA